jgi:hypothetical protein
VLEDQAGGTIDALIWASNTLAEVRRLQGDDRAEESARRGLELAHSIDNRFRAAGSQIVLAHLAAARGDWADAEQILDEALTAIVERGYRVELPRALEARAEVASGLRNHAEAARNLGAAECARRDLGLVAWPAQRAELATLTARVRDALGDSDFGQAQSEGARLAGEAPRSN